MSAEDLELVRRSFELFIGGERDAAWALWSEDCIGIPPRDWPEAGPFEVARTSARPSMAGAPPSVPIGSRTPTVRDVHDLGEGRFLIELGFKTSGIESGIPIDQELASIFTVRGGELVKGDSS